MKDIEIEGAVERVEDAIERVETAVIEAAKSIQKAVEESSFLSSFSSVLNRMFTGFAIFLFCVSVPGEVWHSKLRYELQYGVPSGKLQYDKRPHDCEFLTAPLGNKNCHYERSISTVRYATSTKGLPILSVDDGKTWTTFTPDAGVTVPSSSTVERVFITWEKKED